MTGPFPAAICTAVAHRPASWSLKAVLFPVLAPCPCLVLFQTRPVLTPVPSRRPLAPKSHVCILGFSLCLLVSSFSKVSKAKVVVLSQIKLFEQVLEVGRFKYLGIWFDQRIHWKGQIDKVLVKCKKILNIIRCLNGEDWGEGT